MPGNSPVERYFERWYPRRSNLLSGVVFRRSDAETLAQLRRWVPPLPDLDVLDAGCGDGALLAELLSSEPNLVHLEDIAERNVRSAAVRLAGRARRVESVRCDLRRSEDTRRYDLVLALGVFDYNSDWKVLLEKLMRRRRAILVFDLPRAGALHHQLRKVWLALHGIELQTATRAEIDQLVRNLGEPVEVASTRLNWMVRVGSPPGRE